MQCSDRHTRASNRPLIRRLEASFDAAKVRAGRARARPSLRNGYAFAPRPVSIPEDSMRHLVTALLASLPFVASAQAPQSPPPVQPAQAFPIGPVVVKAPDEPGWQLARGDSSGVALRQQTGNQVRLAYAQLVNWQAPFDRESFTKLAKKSVGEMLLAVPGSTLDKIAYDYRDDKSLPCLNVQATVDVPKQPDWSSDYSRKFHYQVNLCRMAGDPQSGVLAGYTYNHDAAQDTLDAQAQTFLKTLVLKGR